MTFSQSVKQELCNAKLHCQECGFVFTYAAIRFAPVKEPGVLYRSDYRETIVLLAEKLVEETGVIATVTDPDLTARAKNKVFLLTLEDPEDRAAFERRYGNPLEECLQRLKRDCCRAAFLRGLFISCGSVVDPSREYHLELKFPDRGQADLIRNLYAEYGFPFHQTKRKGQEILYLKESEHIEDLLTYMGAVKSAMSMMDVKIVKEVRNNVNRITNCETANIQKTVAASVRQVQDIELILKEKGLGYLSDDLQKTAEARLQYPELSLGELCGVLNCGLSKSGLNHRLKKLSSIAEELRQQK